MMKKSLMLLLLVLLSLGLTQRVGAKPIFEIGDVDRSATTTAVESGFGYSLDENDDMILVTKTKPKISLGAVGNFGGSSSGGGQGPGNILSLSDLGGDSGVVLTNGSDTPVPTPEPATMLLLGCGLVGLAALSRKFKKS